METPRNDEAIGFNGFGQIGGTAFRQYLSLPPDQRSGRTIVIPVRYNNVLASGNEAVLMMQRIQAIRGELAAKIGA